MPMNAALQYAIPVLGAAADVEADDGRQLIYLTLTLTLTLTLS